MIHEALVYAMMAHRSIGQKRNYTGEPYVVHPVEVMGLLLAHTTGRFLKPPVLAAALLHDVVEDTFVTIEDIMDQFGTDVARYVNGLTDKYSNGYADETGRILNRAERSAREAKRLWCECEIIQTIKCADLISNTRSIVAHDSGFAKTYLPEKRLILSGLHRAHQTLYNLAQTSLRQAEADLAKR